MNESNRPFVINPLNRHYDVRIMTSLGFALVITILTISIIGSYQATSSHNQALAEEAQRSGMKTALSFTMREAIRERIDSLNRMSLLQDYFDRDAEKMQFFAYASKYIKARTQLNEQIDNEAEHRIFERIDATARDVGTPNTQALSALFDENLPAEKIRSAVQASIDGHLVLLKHLDEMVRAIHQSTQARIREAGDEFNSTLLMLTLIGVLAFIIAVITAAYVVIHAGARNRQLSHHAAHDALTGLLNRQAFEASLTLTLEQCALSPANHALMFLDLDRFKVVNDTAGHPAGDALLKALANRFSTCLRHSDILARIGGDEFGVILRYIEPQDAEAVAEKLRKGIETFDFSWNGESFKVGSSIGMVSFGEQEVTVDELLGNADACCYSAKEEGRNRVHIADGNDDSLRRLTCESRWINRINDAIDNDRFVLYGQMIKPLNPSVDDGRLTLEVLLRMKDYDGTALIPPGQFLPAAERYGIVPEIDRWVVRNSLQWLADLGDIAKDLRININICGPAASDPKFHEYVRKCIQEYGVPPKSLCFELTESTAISSLANAAALIEALGDLGCQFALDDFGSGLSSFNQLRHLAVDYLKIDGSFVLDIDRDEVNLAMVESINTIGKKLGKRTVAEYVENDRVRKILQGIGVDFAQGFGLHRPEPLSNIQRTIRESGVHSEAQMHGPSVA